MRKLTNKLNDIATYLYCRVKAVKHAIVDVAADEAGLSKLAITLILLAAGVALTLGVIAIIAPELLGLAEKVGKEIEGVPLDDPGGW